MDGPLISVITVVYNANNTLEKTIKSVLSQKIDLFEYLIIDGGSTDGSLDVIRKYEDKLCSWVSEPDTGIYDAMNKGIDRASGNWLYFLGGDDTLQLGIFDEIQKYLSKDYAMIYGKVLFDNGHIMQSFLGPRTILQNTIHHQSAFYNASLFSTFRYDTTLRIVSEYDLHLRLYVDKAAAKYVPVLVATCATGGASSELPLSLKETNQIRSRYVKSKFKNKMLSAFLTLYYSQKRIRFLLYGHRV